jgi:hypothetical protein
VKFAITIAALLACFAAQPTLAGEAASCHFHGNKPASELTVLACAEQRKKALVATGKIDPAWLAVAHEKVEQVDGKKAKEWKITFRNAAASDANKARLYLFYTLPGNFIAANHSGQ